MRRYYDVVVVGGGPAGIMAAITAKENYKDKKICILEHRDFLGKKLSITGGGRCNITNSLDISDFFDNIVSNEKFLYSSLYAFTNEDTISFLKKMDIQTIEEENGKVYFKNINGKVFTERLYKKLIEIDIDVYFNEEVKNFELDSSTNDIAQNNDKKTLNYNKIIETNDNIYYSEKIVFATGGVSYPMLSSKGELLEKLKNNGYTITKLYPALVPIKIKENWIKTIPGISLENIEIKVMSKNDKGKKRVIKKIVGDIVFTHKGIGGPAALKTSSYINKDINKYYLEVNFINDFTSNELFELIRGTKKKLLQNILKEYLPSNFVKALLAYCNSINDGKFDYEKSLVDDISNNDIDLLINVLKNCTLTPTALENIEKATVTSGGVSIKMINSSTMESKLHRGVYFAGEMIDVDALTGGFNLQIAFSTGYLAGYSLYYR